MDISPRMPLPCSFDEFASFVRENQGISPKRAILPTTLIEKDLGITGDDGDELLLAIQRHFAVSFVGPDGSIRKAFGLNEGQFLFHGEAVSAFYLLARLFGGKLQSDNVVPITMGQLYEVTCRIFTEQHGSGEM